MRRRRRKGSSSEVERAALRSRYARLGVSTALSSNNPRLVALALRQLACAYAEHGALLQEEAQQDLRVAVTALESLARAGMMTNDLQRAVGTAFSACPAKVEAAYDRDLRKKLILIKRESKRDVVDASGGGIPYTALPFVLACLRDPRDLAAASCVNKAWRDAAGDQTLWKRLLEERGCSLPRRCTLDDARRLFGHQAKKKGATFVLGDGLYRCTRCRHFVWLRAGGRAPDAGQCIGGTNHMASSAVLPTMAVQLTLNLGLDVIESDDESSDDDGGGGGSWWSKAP